MTEAPVIVSKDGKAGRLTLNNPAALHALNLPMCLIMYEALKAWKDDPEIELVLLDHAADTRGFCAGGDIRMLAESGKSGGEEGHAFFAAEYRLNTLIHNYPKPYIAFMDGVTMGGGVGISVHGGARIATENTLFAMPESGIGLFPDVGGGWFLPRLSGQLGMWLALTGARLKGADVLAAGVATHFASSGDLEPLKTQLAQTGQAALEKLETTADGSFASHRETIDACFSKDSVEEIFSALEQNGGDWALKQLSLLKSKCPTTLKVAYRQLREGALCKTMEANMRMEYRIGSRMILRPDFQEGVRAVIVDKDNSPKWSPATIEEVNPKIVEEIFAPLQEELTFEE